MRYMKKYEKYTVGMMKVKTAATTSRKFRLFGALNRWKAKRASPLAGILLIRSLIVSETMTASKNVLKVVAM